MTRLPCNPGADVATIKARIHEKYGVPIAHLNHLSGERLCEIYQTCGNFKHHVLPPMTPQTAKDGNTYLVDPRFVDKLGINDYLTVLTPGAEVKDLKRVAKKIGMVTLSDAEPTVRGMTTNLIDHFVSLGIREPIHLPFKVTRKTREAMENINMNKPMNIVEQSNFPPDTGNLPGNLSGNLPGNLSGNFPKPLNFNKNTNGSGIPNISNLKRANESLSQNRAQRREAAFNRMNASRAAAGATFPGRGTSREFNNFSRELFKAASGGVRGVRKNGFPTSGVSQPRNEVNRVPEPVRRTAKTRENATKQNNNTSSTLATVVGPAAAGLVGAALGAAASRSGNGNGNENGNGKVNTDRTYPKLVHKNMPQRVLNHLQTVDDDRIKFFTLYEALQRMRETSRINLNQRYFLSQRHRDKGAALKRILRGMTVNKHKNLQELMESLKEENSNGVSPPPSSSGGASPAPSLSGEAPTPPSSTGEGEDSTGGDANNAKLSELKRELKAMITDGAVRNEAVKKIKNSPIMDELEITIADITGRDKFHRFINTLNLPMATRLKDLLNANTSRVLRKRSGNIKGMGDTLSGLRKQVSE
jgi:hypothetical protein